LKILTPENNVPDITFKDKETNKNFEGAYQVKPSKNWTPEVVQNLRGIPV
jgi:hypothetical protein